ncbi:unnamed protein product [Symbiodinium natans]|uniref:Uncharacterized protein n=1 Tax=Symbiodinium natans TaxID=878477 RepID=A0A812K1G2_9DINO|nr:unnamed protein product [Symbiodinium natans]
MGGGSWGKKGGKYAGSQTGKGRFGWDSTGGGCRSGWDSAGGWNSWQNSDYQEWPQTSGKGDGKSKGSKHGQEAEPQDYVRRLEGRYAFAKSVLRPYSDSQGAVVYGPTSEGHVCFEKSHLRTILDRGNSELIRRPAVGLSTTASSVTALATLLEEAEESHNPVALGWSAMQQVRGILGADNAEDFRAACRALSGDKSAKNMGHKLEGHVKAWLEFLRANKNSLASQLAAVADMSSRLYLGSVQLLECVTMSNALQNWAEKIPMTHANQAALQSWQRNPKDVRKAWKFLVASVDSRKQEERFRASSGWGGDSDEDEAVPWDARPARRARVDTSSSGASSSVSRKKASKPSKKHKKEGKRKLGDVEKSSSERRGRKRRHREEDSESDEIESKKPATAGPAKKSKPGVEISSGARRGSARKHREEGSESAKKESKKPATARPEHVPTAGASTRRADEKPLCAGSADDALAENEGNAEMANAASTAHTASAGEEMSEFEEK